MRTKLSTLLNRPVILRPPTLEEYTRDVNSFKDNTILICETDSNKPVAHIEVADIFDWDGNYFDIDCELVP